MTLPPSVRAAIEAAPLATIVTIAKDGRPQVSMCWLGLDGDELVVGTLFDQAKLRNLRRDPRVAIHFQTGQTSSIGLPGYLVVHGRARITEGGAPQLLNQLAQRYIGPGTVYPPFPNPPGGFVTHVEVERISGSDPVPAAG